ncbi:MAG TPA: LytTR family DNA-binding domain-containing protein [Bacteroidia bacterium]
MIKAIIVDDETASLEMLSGFIGAFDKEIKLCSVCQNIDQALKSIREYEPELLLLDIELGEGLSFEILEHFPELRAHILFITAYDRYVLKALKYHAFDYLFKPINRIEFNTAIKKVLDNIRKMQPLSDINALISELKGVNKFRIAVPNKSGLSYYNTDEIVYIEADGSYSIMHLKDQRSIVITRKIKDFEETLSPKGFIRVHKSYLVNIDCIIELHRNDSGYLLMSDQAKIPISPKDKESIIQKIKMASHLI